ncbi:MAG TPA: 6-carboxytetrahydropterin synthase [Hyphomicrobiaceae bacterium]|nr:6-carboxytetrahydropterin synthase [Hyphomicrobiaceae bacterium]
MYAVEVRDAIMIAHSLPDPFFGPAQNKHGATFVVDVTFFRETLSRENVVVDIGRAGTALKEILKPLSYQDLDTIPEFKGVLTTTEFLCRHIFDSMRAAISRGDLGPGSEDLAKIRVTLGETHLARAWFEGPLRA